MKRILIIAMLLGSTAQAAEVCRSTATVVQHQQVLVNGAVAIYPNAGQYIQTGYAIPVEVPVARYTPYWYSTAQMLQGTVPAVQPRAQAAKAAKEAVENQGDAHITDRQETDLTALANNCAKCHSGDKPKGGLSLDNLATVTESQRLKAISMVMAGKMPKGKKDDMKPEDIASILRVMAGSEKEPGPSE